MVSNTCCYGITRDELATGGQAVKTAQPEPAAACLSDQQVLAAIWSHIEQLLSSAHSTAHASISQLTSRLQQLDALPSDALASVAHLHLNSAGHLMATVKLLVPEAFEEGGCEPRLAIIAAVPGPAVGMVSTLIDLQLFCLARAKQVTAEMRRRIAVERIAALQQLQQQAQAQQSIVSASTSNGTLSDDSMVESLE